MYRFKKLVLVIFLEVFLLFSNQNIVKADYTFNENFSGSISEQWIKLGDHPDPQLEIIDSIESATFTATPSSSFPYLGYTSSDPLRTIRLSFYYDQTHGGSTQGAGFMLSNSIPTYSQIPPNNIDNYSIGIWPLSDGYFYLLTPMCDKVEICNLSIYPRAFYKLNLNTNNEVEIVYESFDAKVKVNGEVFTFPMTDSPPAGFFLGNPEITTNPQTWPTYSISKIYAYSSLIYTPTPSPSPSAFPYLSQKDEKWGSEEYDTASGWAGTGKTGIDRWGCALTSVAMILQNLEVKMPAGETVTPLLLNAWLKAQADGYVRGGLLNWLAIPRLVREAYTTGRATSDVEYNRTGYDATNLTTPSILQEPAHFIVGTGTDGDNITVADPNDASRSAIAKTSDIRSVGVYTPSHTDLSYFLFVTSPGTSLTVTDATGSAAAVTSEEETITDDVDGSGSTTAKLWYVPKPASGSYRVASTGDSDTLEAYLYDVDGQVQRFNFDLPTGSHTFAVESGIMVEIDVTAPPVPTLLTPASGTHTPTAGLVLDWSDVTDPSVPVTYEYRSAWTGGSYGPVSTGTTSLIHADGSPDQTYQWSVRVCDSAKNCSAWSEPWTLVVDSTAPAAPTILTPTEDSAYRAQPIIDSWTGVTDPSGIREYRVEYSYDDGHTFAEGPYRITTGTSRPHVPAISEQGGVKYRVQAVDGAGNYGTWSAWRHYYYDATVPTTPIVALLTATPTNGGVQDWGWSGSDNSGGSGLSGYYTRTHDFLADILSDWRWMAMATTTSTTLADGEWGMDVQAVDRAGNYSAVGSSSRLLVDTVAPTLSARTHFGSPWYRMPQTSIFTFTDLHLLPSYSDPTCTILVEGASSYCTYETPVCDTALNCTTKPSYSETIGLDMTAPTATISLWGSELAGEAADSLSGVAYVDVVYTKDGGDSTTGRAEGTDNWSYHFPNPIVGNYEVTVYAYDAAGNKSVGAAKTFTINAATPGNSETTTEPAPPQVLGVAVDEPVESEPVPEVLGAAVVPSPSPEPSAEPVKQTPKPNPVLLWWLAAGIPFLLFYLVISRRFHR